MGKFLRFFSRFELRISIYDSEREQRKRTTPFKHSRHWTQHTTTRGTHIELSLIIGCFGDERCAHELQFNRVGGGELLPAARSAAAGLNIWEAKLGEHVVEC